MLYPLKFRPILKETIWGGNYLYKELNKGASLEAKIGESWEISSVEGNISVVANGILKDNTLLELIEVYMGDLVGEKIYDKFGLEFPLLIKFIDAQENLSIQVHPNEQLATKKYQAHGKTEMWYVLDAEKNAKIVAGFDKKVSQFEFQTAIENKTIEKLLRFDTSNRGDVFFVPAGQIHTIGGGNVLVEIQQTSDITFRVYDYDRRDKDGKMRDLHVQESLESINFNTLDNYKKEYKKVSNEPANLAQCDYFTSNYFSFNQRVGRDYYFLESFVVLICVEGEFDIEYNGNEYITVKKGESILLPASIREYFFNPKTNQATFLETYLEFK